LLNPLLVEGQVHGGIAQGVGQALLEKTVYSDDGQLLSGSFMDYCMPRADDFPSFDFSNVVIPCQNNPRGIKGCGEAGSVAAPAAIINAVVDALAKDGIDHVDMPATPQTIWQTIQSSSAP
jgi:carbon-monoxide dehydrogenase large subunit